MITVFFDATPLALWAQSHEHRTGVGRVAINILQTFALQKDLRIILLCPRGMQPYVLQFISENIWTKNIIFPYDNTGYPQTSWKKDAKAFCVRLLRKVPIKLQAIIKKILQPIPYKEFRSFSSELHDIVAKHLHPKERTIYFSAYDPVPVAICEFKNIERHVFLHDIIPLRLKDMHFGTHMTLQLCKDHIERANIIWCNSTFTKTDFLKFFPYVSPEKCRVSFLGGGERFSPAPCEKVISVRKQSNIPPQVPFILSVATLEPRKGMAHLIQAFEQLQNENKIPHTHLVLVGQKGWAYSEILNAAQSKDKIHFTGFLSDDALEALMTDCTCFAYLSEYEGFGLPVLEAMACGAAVVTTNTTSLPEVAGDAAILVPPREVNSIASAIYELCAREEKRNILKEKALKQAQNFTWEKCVNRILLP